MVPKMLYLIVLGACRGFFQHQVPVQHPVVLPSAGPSTTAFATRAAAEQPVTLLLGPASHAMKYGPAVRDSSSTCSGWVVLAALAVVGTATNLAKLTRKRAVVTHELAEAVVQQCELVSTQARHKLAMLAVEGVSGTERFDGTAYAKTLPGICEPTGFFDPLGFCSDPGITKSKINYMREAELKHGRVGMLASLGFIITGWAGYHPFFGGNIESTGIDALGDPALQRFWPFIFVLIGSFEAFAGLVDFEKPQARNFNITAGWTAKEDKELGKYGLLVFDPLKLAPKDPEEYKEMQTRELNNGRLGMLAAGGIIAQEMATKAPFTEGLYANFDKIVGIVFWVSLFEMFRFGGQKRWDFVGAKMKERKEALAANPPKPFNLQEWIAEQPGIGSPTGYFDPLGFLTGDLTEGQAKYFREAELKHGRLGMLAAAGILVGENYHPFFGGNIDTPAIYAFQAPELQQFWKIAVPAVMLCEVVSIAAYESSEKDGGKWSTKNFWSVSPLHEPGDYAFDPLDLLPADPEKRKERQTQEINNGRAGMLGAGGMLAQEMVTGEKIFDTPNLGPSIAAAAGGIGLVTAAGLAFWDLAEDKNSGFQGTETASRWKFAPDRWENAEFAPDYVDPNSGRQVTNNIAAPVDRPAFDGEEYAKTLPGIFAAVAPGQQGLWDPLKFCSQPGVTKQKVDFYRDAEMKHGRLGMLASVGILMSESFHPFGGSKLDGVPAVFAMGKTQLPGYFYAALLLAIGISESRVMGSSYDRTKDRQWDPLNQSKDALELKENQDIELAFGRIGMIGAIGMITQEMITNSPILSSL